MHFARKLGFEGPTDLFLKRASKSLIRLCLRAILEETETSFRSRNHDCVPRSSEINPYPSN